MSWFEKLTLMITAIGLYNCVRFVWRYRKRSHGKWRNTPHGRYMMWTALVLGSLFALIISNRLWPDWPGIHPLTVVLYILYVAFTGYLNRIFEISLPETLEDKEIEDAEPTPDLRA